MQIQTNVSPPSMAHRHRRYADLIEVLKRKDGWVAVLASDIGGNSTAAKQSSVHGTCRRAGLRVETRTTATQVFIRTMNATEVRNAN